MWSPRVRARGCVRACVLSYNMCVAYMAVSGLRPKRCGIPHMSHCAALQRFETVVWPRIPNVASDFLTVAPPTTSDVPARGNSERRQRATVRALRMVSTHNEGAVWYRVHPHQG